MHKLTFHILNLYFYCSITAYKNNTQLIHEFLSRKKYSRRNLYDVLCFFSFCGFFPKEQSDDEWSKAFFLRKLTDRQLQEPHELGRTLAARISAGEIRPFDAAMAMEGLE
jgi:hypothetical protein